MVGLFAIVSAASSWHRNKRARQQRQQQQLGADYQIRMQIRLGLILSRLNLLCFERPEVRRRMWPAPGHNLAPVSLLVLVSERASKLVNFRARASSSLKLRVRSWANSNLQPKANLKLAHVRRGPIDLRQASTRREGKGTRSDRVARECRQWLATDEVGDLCV